MADQINLPGSSIDELSKVIQGYGHVQAPASLEEVASLTGLHKTTISRSNRFLADVGLISAGQKKQPTELGRRLARALEHGQEEDAINYWAQSVQSVERLAGLITQLRIQGGMSENDFVGKILYVSGQKSTQSNRTGARCIADVLLRSRLIAEQDGRFAVATPETKETEFDEEARQSKLGSVAQSDAQEPTPETVPFFEPNTRGVQVALNIQLHLPESNDPAVFDAIFKSLDEHILSKSGS